MFVPVCLQLYSIKDYVANDMIGSLEKVKQAGYDAVEFAGYHGLSASSLKNELTRIGLTPLSSHVGFDQLEKDPRAVLDYSLELGLKYVVCPGADMSDLNAVKNAADILNRAARMFRDKGITLGYHNHNSEFRMIDNRYALDIFLELTAETGVFAQIDTYWAMYAEVDPLTYIKSIGDRAVTYHFKEMLAADKEKGVAVGEGDIDFSSIVDYMLASGNGSQGIIVEQESFDGDPFICLKKSCSHIKELLNSKNK